jgi:hypothetical protein
LAGLHQLDSNILPELLVEPKVAVARGFRQIQRCKFLVAIIQQCEQTAVMIDNLHDLVFQLRNLSSADEHVRGDLGGLQNQAGMAADGLTQIESELPLGLAGAQQEREGGDNPHGCHIGLDSVRLIDRTEVPCYSGMKGVSMPRYQLVSMVLIGSVLIPCGYSQANGTLPPAADIMDRYVAVTGGQSRYDQVQNEIRTLTAKSLK